MVDNTIVDRRKNGKGKGSTIRQKFLKRARGQIKKAVKEAIEKRSVSDIGTSEKDKNKITIPSKDTRQPVFGQGQGGKRDYVLPGNKDKDVGDTIPKPQGGAGQGGGGPEGSPDGEGEDDFEFTLTRDEFLDFFFEDLELPDMVKTTLKEVDQYKLARAGFSVTGMPANLNVIRSMKQALGRRMALQGQYDLEIEELEAELKTAKSKTRQAEIYQKIAELKDARETVPFIDDVDIRYNSFEKRPNPSSKAVMFCLMDVSASMGEHEKDLAKRFFMLLYLFLERHYEKVDVVFIRHHSQAEEVDEHAFFHDRTTGGTVVSTCLDLMQKIVDERYNSADWNIYGSQASDGDNWTGDGEVCRALMHEKIMKMVQHFSYVQIGREQGYDFWGQAYMAGHSQRQLWNDYLEVAQTYENFDMQQIDSAKDIYPVFRKLFKKKGLE